MAESAEPLPKIERVQRNGDFQTIYFTDGSSVYGSSEQFDPDGDWRDSTGIENVLRLAEAADQGLRLARQIIDVFKVDS